MSIHHNVQNVNGARPRSLKRAIPERVLDSAMSTTPAHHLLAVPSRGTRKEWPPEKLRNRPMPGLCTAFEHRTRGSSHRAEFPRISGDRCRISALGVREQGPSHTGLHTPLSGPRHGDGESTEGIIPHSRLHIHGCSKTAHPAATAVWPWPSLIPIRSTFRSRSISSVKEPFA